MPVVEDLGPDTEETEKPVLVTEGSPPKELQLVSSKDEHEDHDDDNEDDEVL